LPNYQGISFDFPLPNNLRQKKKGIFILRERGNVGMGREGRGEKRGEDRERGEGM
jgi:hypothetical protein